MYALNALMYTLIMHYNIRVDICVDVRVNARVNAYTMQFA